MSSDAQMVSDLLADAIDDPAAWPKTLDLVTSRFGSYGAVVLPLVGRGPDVPLTNSLVPLVGDYFERGWHERDERARTMPLLARRGYTVDQDVFTADEMSRGDYWIDFMGRHGLRWFGGIRVDAGEDLWCLALQRTPDQGAFSLEDQARFAPLGGVLSRSAKLLSHVGRARLEGVVDALDAMSVPALVLDRQARVIRLNEPAETSLGTDLTITRGELAVVGRPDLTAALKRHFEAAGRPELPMSAAYLDGVSVPRQRRRPVFVQAHPLRRALADHFSAGQVLVIISDPDDEMIPKRAVLRAMFSLTDSEARLVQALAEGRTLTDAAPRIGVTYATARTYLKSVFAKTGARTQSEIVRIASRLSRA